MGAPTPGGGGHQSMILSNFPKNLEEFGPLGRGKGPKFYYLDPPLFMEFCPISEILKQNSL